MKIKAKLIPYNGDDKYYGTIIELKEDEENIGYIKLWNIESEHIYNIGKEIIKRINNNDFGDD